MADRQFVIYCDAVGGRHLDAAQAKAVKMIGVQVERAIPVFGQCRIQVQASGNLLGGIAKDDVLNSICCGCQLVLQGAAVFDVVRGIRTDDPYATATPGLLCLVVALLSGFSGSGLTVTLEG